MIIYRLTYYRFFTCAVALPVSSPTAIAKLQYSGDAVAIAAISALLPTLPGLFGHILGEHPTAVDLAAAMTSLQMQPYQPELVNGQEVLDQWQPFKLKQGTT